jgi:hypothetical protein
MLMFYYIDFRSVCIPGKPLFSSFKELEFLLGSSTQTCSGLRVVSGKARVRTIQWSFTNG